MFGIQDFETSEGKAALEKYNIEIKRFIRSRGVSGDDVEDLAQETIARVWQNLSNDPTLTVHAGYFVRTAENVVREFQRRKLRELKRFESNQTDDEDENQEPIDTEPQLRKHYEEIERGFKADCILECFNDLSSDEQELLWRYCLDEDLKLEIDEPENYYSFFNTISDTLRNIREKFIPMQKKDDTSVNKSSNTIRTQIRRARKKVKICYQGCYERKKMVQVKQI